MAQKPNIQLRYATLPFLRPIAVHYWFTVGAEERWEVWQAAGRCATCWGYLHRNLAEPDAPVGGGPMHIEMEWSGEEAARLREALVNPLLYPYRETYRYWPGPNSNTYAAWVLRRAGVRHDLDPRAIGKDFLGRRGFGILRGAQVFAMESPLLGIRWARDTLDLEIHILGFTFGMNWKRKVLKTPFGPINF